MRRLGDVAQPDHADIGRDVQPGLAEGMQQTERQLVAGGEDGGESPARAARSRPVPDQCAPGRVARVGAPVAEDGRQHGQARRPQLRLVGPEPALRVVPVGRSGHVHDAAVPLFDEIPHRQPRAAAGVGSAGGAVTAPAFRSSPRDVTIGICASSGAIPETTVSCGATMTTPSTSWPSRSSAAAEIADGEADDRWTTDA